MLRHTYGGALTNANDTAQISHQGANITGRCCCFNIAARRWAACCALTIAAPEVAALLRKIALLFGFLGNM